MAHGRMEMGLVAVLIAMLSVGAAAQSSCTTTIISLSPCLSYIMGNSSTPSSTCCSQLTSVVNTSPQCLCAVLNGGGSNLGLNINQTQALALPGACNVQTPPLSRCNAASPAASPPAAASPPVAASPAAADSPASADSPGGTISEPSVPSGTGSKTVPSTGGNSSEASSTNLHLSLLFFLLFIASYGSTFISI